MIYSCILPLQDVVFLSTYKALAAYMQQLLRACSAPDESALERSQGLVLRLKCMESVKYRVYTYMSENCIMFCVYKSRSG